MKIILLLTLLAFAWSATEVGAQIVDLQSEVNKKIVEPGFTGAVAGSWDRRSGNTDLESASASGLIRYRHHTPETVIFMYRKETGEKSGKKYLNNEFIHGRYRWEISQFANAEIFALADFNEFRGYRFRDVLGVGPLLKWVDKDDFTLYTGLAYLIEHEVLTTKDAEGDYERKQAERYSLAVLYNQEWLPGFTTSLSAYYQPDVYHKDNHRTMLTYGLAFAMTENLSYTFTGYQATNPNPPEGIAKTDQRYKNGLKLIF